MKFKYSNKKNKKIRIDKNKKTIENQSSRRIKEKERI